jgi:thymidylate synthase (FAD)
MMEVTLISHMGTDLSVVNAARVSFDKVSSYEEQRDGTWVLPDKDIRLLSYLAKHNHWSPFTHATLSFRVKAPIFVARQLQKHQVGLSWNEVSRRYVDSPPEFYVPDVWRKRAENVKQGSSDERVAISGWWYTEAVAECLSVYDKLLKSGVAPEQARMVLPQSMMTEWIWTGSLYAFFRVCSLRLDPHTQKETQEVARKIMVETQKLFPYSWEALTDNEEKADG